MTRENHNTEWIVAEVIRRLRQAGIATGSSDVSVTCPHPRPDTSQLVLRERVVTLAVLDGRLANVCQVVVPARAVVTPAVVDQLRDLEISLVRSPAARPASGDSRVVLPEVRVREPVGAICRAVDRRVARAFEANLPGADTRTFSDHDAGIAALADAIAHPKYVGVLVTDRVWRAVCRANRVGHVRAVTARGANELDAALRDVEANLLVAAPQTVVSPEWKKMVDLLCQTPS